MTGRCTRRCFCGGDPGHGSLPCPVEGCGAEFSHTPGLRTHLKVSHAVLGDRLMSLALDTGRAAAKGWPLGQFLDRFRAAWAREVRA